MDPETEKQITEAVFSGIQVETTFNKEDDSLPYGYFKARTGPGETEFPPEMVGKLIWVCNYDAENKITSVFLWTGDGSKDRQVTYVPTIEEAKKMRNTLIHSGWEKLKDPEITFSYAGDEKNEKTELNRRERRALKKKVEKMNKRNPFDK